MSESFVFPTTISLPLGYRCTVIPPLGQIEQRLVADSADVILSHKVIYEGETVHEHCVNLSFRQGKLTGETPPPAVFADGVDEGRTHPSYLEMVIESVDGAAVFSHKTVFGLYSVYSKPGKKSFLSDNAYKYGAPPVVSMMARFRRFVDTYPVVHLDRDRDLGESLAFINPYHKAIVAQVVTDDGRGPIRLRIPARSARYMALSQLLEDDEQTWFGQVQVTANNRAVIFDIKHSLSDPHVISDHEHMDPFRADATHIPATLALRRNIYRWLTGRG
jgi:hypothetical protein